MSHVYIIKSIEGLIYVVSTTDLTKRLYQHQNKLAGWTKRRNDWKLIYSEEFEIIRMPENVRFGLRQE